MVRMPGIGTQTIVRLLEHFPVDQIFNSSINSLKGLGFSDKIIASLHQPDWTAVEQDLHWLEQAGNFFFTLADNDYPALLKEISQPPPVLFVKGHPELLSYPQIAMVGSRNPSAQGSKIALEFAEALAASGFTITSGMALGIDAASHQGAININGRTIAVAGTGLDRVYPACHKLLAQKIVETGALVSEFPPGTHAKANHFPRRNRIISGLSIGLLVVEAAQQSGSLITARLALEQNREVFAIPGSINNPLARGCNALIREGAKLVENVQDIFEEFSQYTQAPINNTSNNYPVNLDLEQQNLLNLIDYNPISVDTLVKLSGWSVEMVSSMLLVLELKGYIATAAGGCYFRI